MDPAKADYAVFTGIQIHNWTEVFENGELNFEFIMPCKGYVVENGKQRPIDLSSISVRPVYSARARAFFLNASEKRQFVNTRCSALLAFQ